MAEAVTLSVLGGAVGILGGLCASKAVTEVLEWPTLISVETVATAAGFSAAVGVFFGFWPAWKASHLNPIDALRYE
jgi:putative ABC transport system permease protein